MCSSKLNEKEFCKAAEDFALNGTILLEDKPSYDLFFQSGKQSSSSDSNISTQIFKTAGVENIESLLEYRVKIVNSPTISYPNKTMRH